MKSNILCCVLFGLIIHPPIREIPNIGPIVTDIESHLYEGNPYREDTDLVGWVHEGTQGINSLLREKYKTPGFYLLNSQAYLLREPNTTLAEVSTKVPESLRGRVYDTYCIAMQGQWNNQPSYLFDEWVSYINGTIARRALKISNRQETEEFAVELCIYSLCLAYTTPVDENTDIFIHIMYDRTRELCPNDPKWHILNTSPDAKQLKKFVRKNYNGFRHRRRVLSNRG
jgi:hypothetical protein